MRWLRRAKPKRWLIRKRRGIWTATGSHGWIAAAPTWQQLAEIVQRLDRMVER